MARMVHCVKLKQEAEGLEAPPYPGELGIRIWQNISKQAWAQWVETQTRLVNENRLNLADVRARKYLAQQMESFLFDDANVEAQGYVPPSA
ncbi:oxidative damage protection protein [Pusillimonas noertemannii]|uniref:Probable Fe(2+)-trafficking protein n=1 Tax=Pusillimonas noertemannii TaxID=305977 RepID=A0A2U1CI30_9BURK|nr:oxidative damage protection protein [Pusillimonas noertemannii]NYT69545.1 oxidative damage protection protein [Pusillimonas noertemannii]PVY60579.1 Fe-S cluster biosynthesis and repair protein YggX [Pusillimonas noertemannii]TFL09926.1 oxidative damage protection protein [Pusillimonas noertemannii]